MSGRSGSGKEDGTTASAWRPVATPAVLRRRARMYTDIRAFFHHRNVLEVDTPVLSAAGTTDPNIESFTTCYEGPGGPRPLYLHTSPEFPMKRLLAAGSGAIYQLCKVFRQGEAGRRHQPEFTMLEWYRPGLDHFALMEEVEALVRAVLPELSLGPTVTLSYAEAFRRYVGIDPHNATGEALAACATDHGLMVGNAAQSGSGRSSQAGPRDDWSRDTWLELLQAEVLEPALPGGQPVFLHAFPASQAALARVSAGTPTVAERFELYINGMELANGFHELGDAGEQRRRFEADQARRAASGQVPVPFDEHLLQALTQGLPDCAGVALGIDRLLMLALGAASIKEVVAFPFARA